MDEHLERIGKQLLNDFEKIEKVTRILDVMGLPRGISELALFNEIGVRRWVILKDTHVYTVVIVGYPYPHVEIWTNNDTDKGLGGININDYNIDDIELIINKIQEIKNA